MAKGNSTKRALTEMANCLTGFSVPLPNLPEEIIIEILLRLPVKSILRFRCVSKSWLSLISSPKFVEAHFKISSKNNMGCHNRLLFGSGPRPSVFNTFPLYPNKDENSSVDTLVLDYPLSNSDDDGTRIVGSCNGLVCVVLEPRTVVLWNPATRKSKKLPISGRDIYAAEYGFGYDAVNDDYKVVEFSWIDREEVDETQVKVYSSRADSWRIVDWPNGKIVDGPGVFVNGAIHWKVYYDDRSDWDVIAQNVTTETCSVVELPMSVSGDARVILGVSGGCLCASYDYDSYFTIDVWVMKEYGVKESWTKLICVPYIFTYDVSPKRLFVLENGGVILNLGSHLLMYKPSQYHEVYEVYRLSNDIRVEPATYNESLLSPGFDHYGSELGSN